MSDLIDMFAMLAEEPEPEPEPVLAQPRTLYDPDRPTRGYLGTARKGSGPWRARKATWRTFVAMVAHRETMLDSDYKVLNAVLTMMHRAGTDRLTVSILEIETEAGTKHTTTINAMNRILADRWLIRVREGRTGKPKDGATGSGRSAEYRLPAPPQSPTSRRRTSHECDLDGRAQPDHDTVKMKRTTKFLSNHSTHGYPVSGQVAEGSETLADSGAVSPGETLAKPAKDWLRDRLSQGPEMTKVIVAEGVKAGYGRASIYRVAKALGVVSTYLQGFGEGNQKPPPHVTQWELP